MELKLSTAPKPEHYSAIKPNMMVLGLSALGIVFGDIGTSPLYTFRAVLSLTGTTSDLQAILGSFSLILWTLIIVTTIKYVNVAMRVDNDGEGGILALMSLLGVKTRHRPFIVFVGVIGAALIYGDGAITPAISVLSALEGLNVVTPDFQPYILPLSVMILLGLFMIQPKGTKSLGKAFGPIMAVWFVTIALLGIGGILKHPSVLVAVNPVYGLRYLFSSGTTGFLVLGGVFLCVTGAEALYADMGHFGAKSIRVAWSWLVFPSLVLNYAGQAALVLDGASATDNIFYKLCPEPLLIPLVIMATVATIIASQSIITGTFSMTRQAIQLGWLPPLQIKQTSEEGFGQIYVGIVNWILMAATIGLAVTFRKSDNLASAYGIAVSATMLATSWLLFIAMREIWKWNLLKALIVSGIFMVIDASFFIANLSKVMEGGYVPILFAGIVYGVMYTWHKGVEVISLQLNKKNVPIDVFMEDIKQRNIPRVHGTAVFLTRIGQDTPATMVWHVKQNHVLHKKIFIINVNTLSVPWVKKKERLKVDEIAHNIWRGTANYGFMERPDIPNLLMQALFIHGHNINITDVTYYVGHETIIPAQGMSALPRFITSTFAFMQRNSLHISDYFRLPADSVVEIGRQIAI